MGGYRGGRDLRGRHAVASNPHWAHRRRLRHHHVQLCGVHRTLHRCDQEWRRRVAGDSGRCCLAFPVPAFRPARALPADPNADRVGSSSHARSGHRHAVDVRNAGPGSRRESGTRRTLVRGHNCACYRCDRAEGSRCGPPVGTRHRRGRGLRRRWSLRALRLRTHRRRPLARASLGGVARHRSGLRSGLLVACSAIPAGDADHDPSFDQQQRGSAERVVATETSDRLSRGPGSGKRRWDH